MVGQRAQSEIECSMYKRYVDDINMVISATQPGMRYKNKKLYLSRNAICEDQGIGADKRTMLLIQDIGNDIHPSIQLEVDFPSNHEDGKMPILDLKVWIEKHEAHAMIMHEFYSKEVSSKNVINAKSAIPWSTKRTVLTQEILRVLLNCSKRLPWDVPTTKSLGVIIDEGLKWKDQYKSLIGKLAGGLSSLKKLKDVLPQSKLCDVYHALFESHIRYGNVVWGTISSSELQALQSLQKRAISIIDRARFQDLWPKKLLSVMNLIRFDLCVMVYKIANKQCPESLWNMFQQRCSISNYNTRNYRDLHIPKLNLELTKKGFHYSGIKAWNDIPVNIRELPSLRLFKTHLRRHLISFDN